MSLEALSHVACACFPIFEQDKIDVKTEYSNKEKPNRATTNTPTSVLPPPIPVLSRHSSYNVPYTAPQKYVAEFPLDREAAMQLSYFACHVYCHVY
jgi:hypothetical protein